MKWLILGMKWQCYRIVFVIFGRDIFVQNAIFPRETKMKHNPPKWLTQRQYDPWMLLDAEVHFRTCEVNGDPIVDCYRLRFFRVAPTSEILALPGSFINKLTLAYNQNINSLDPSLVVNHWTANWDANLHATPGLSRQARHSMLIKVL